MKLAIINDTHFGARNDSSVILDHQQRFFDETFFPYLEENKIKRILHLGDLFDRRKYVNFKTLDRVEDFFFQRALTEDIKIDVIAGNHDVYYKDTNRVNSLRLLAEQYDNINIFDNDPVTRNYGGVKVALIPWICYENYEKCIKYIENTDADIVAGHFEIVGFEFMPGIKNHEGLSRSTFKRFDQVWSGHFHHKSKRGNISYLGTQYQMTWSDEGQRKGFHVFDSKTEELEFVKNKDILFHKIFYDDTKNDYSKFNYEALTNQYVKVVVVDKSDHFVFDRFIDKIQNVNPADLSIVEDPQVLEDDDIDINETMDTITLLENYIDQIDVNVDKNKIKKIVRELHTEALSID